MARVRWAVEALRDLDAIHGQISQSSREQAIIMIAALVGATDVLTTYTRIGRVVPEVEDDTLRELIVSPYRILYRLDAAGDVRLLAVVHGAMELRHFLRERVDQGDEE